MLFDILQVALLKVVFFGRFPASDKGGMNLSNGLPSNWKTYPGNEKPFLTTGTSTTKREKSQERLKTIY